MSVCYYEFEDLKMDNVIIFLLVMLLLLLFSQIPRKKQI